MNLHTVIYLIVSAITVVMGGVIVATMIDRAGKSIANQTLRAYLIKHTAMVLFGIVAILAGFDLISDWLGGALMSTLYWVDIRCSKSKWKGGQSVDSKRADPAHGENVTAQKFTALEQRIPDAPDSQARS